MLFIAIDFPLYSSVGWYHFLLSVAIWYYKFRTTFAAFNQPFNHRNIDARPYKGWVDCLGL